jgi:WD40 repeat protein
VRWVEFSPNGAWLVTASFDKTAQVWDTRTGQRVGKTIEHDSRVFAARFSPDGTRVVTSSQDGSARVWDAATGEPMTPPMQAGPSLHNARFTPDGRKVVTAGQDHTTRIWDAATGKQILPSLEHSDELALYSPDISSDGRRVLTAAGNSARIWDTETGQPLTEALTHTAVVRSAWFSPDGSCVVTTSADKTARLWDAANGLPISEPLPHEDAVANAFFSPDGRWLLTLSEDSHARLWEVPVASTPIPTWLPDLAEAVGGVRFNAQNMLETVPTDTFPKLRARLEAKEGTDRWTVWAKWLFADSSKRAFWPSFPSTEADFGVQAAP